MYTAHSENTILVAGIHNSTYVHRPQFTYIYIIIYHVHDVIVRVCVTMLQGHFRRGAVLEKLGDWVQSVAAFYLCLYFSGTNEMTKVICQASLVI